MLSHVDAIEIDSGAQLKPTISALSDKRFLRHSFWQLTVTLARLHAAQRQFVRGLFRTKLLTCLSEK